MVIRAHPKPSRTKDVVNRTRGGTIPKTQRLESPDTGASVVLSDHLMKRFGDVLAVDDLTFALEHGTVTGFLGPNAAGKTTTLRMLVHLVQPSADEALVFGRP
jgi:ABC-type uncharacterized transport system ATPase subunit